MYKKKSGFTLVELIVVIAIIGILAAVAIPKMDKYIIEARAKANIASAKTVYTAALAYNIDHMDNMSIKQYWDATTIEVHEYPSPFNPAVNTQVFTAKSILSQFLPENIRFVNTPLDVLGDDLFCVSVFLSAPSYVTNINEQLCVYYYDPRLPVTFFESNNLPPELVHNGTVFVDGRAIVVTYLRNQNENYENFNNPDAYPTVEEYLKEYNEYMKNKDTK